MTKTLTPKQEDFLEALIGEARGYLRAAMDLAVYSRTTKTAEAGPLKAKITEQAGMMLKINAPRAAFGIMDLLDDHQLWAPAIRYLKPVRFWSELV